MEPHYHCAIYFANTVAAAITKAYRHRYKDLLIGQSIGCSCKGQVECLREGRHCHSTAAVKEVTAACVVDIVTVDTVAIIVDNRVVVVGLGNLHRKDQGTTMEHGVATATIHGVIFYFGSIGSDHRALVDVHFILGRCPYHRYY